MRKRIIDICSICNKPVYESEKMYELPDGYNHLECQQKEEAENFKLFNVG